MSIKFNPQERNETIVLGTKEQRDAYWKEHSFRIISDYVRYEHNGRKDFYALSAKDNADIVELISNGEISKSNGKILHDYMTDRAMYMVKTNHAFFNSIKEDLPHSVLSEIEKLLK